MIQLVAKIVIAGYVLAMLAVMAIVIVRGERARKRRQHRFEHHGICPCAYCSTDGCS